jgi:hypothetical protein
MIVNKRRRQALIFQIHVLVRGAEEPVAAVRSESDALLRREKRELNRGVDAPPSSLYFFIFFLSPNPLGYKMRVYFRLNHYFRPCKFVIFWL